MELGVHAMLARAAAAEPHRIALSEAATGRRLTWSQLHDVVDRVAAACRTSGLESSDRVAIVMANRLEFVAAYLGVLRAGLVAVPVNPRTTTGEFLRVLGDSGARLAFVDEVSADLARAGVGGMREAVGPDGTAPQVVFVGAETSEGEIGWLRFLDGAADWTPAPVSRDALALLLYTSGATGRPRGAMLTHGALSANIEQVALAQPPLMVGQDVVFGVLPLFHVYGLNGVLGQVIRQRARLVLVDGFDAEGALNIIEDEAVSIVPVSPSVIAHWMQVRGIGERLGPVRSVLSGAAPLSPELAQAFTTVTGVPIYEGYGMTEAGALVTMVLREGEINSEHPAGALGFPVFGLEIRVRNSDASSPDEPALGVPGEVELRGPNLFLGYWPDQSDGPASDGWYATGDIGYLDAHGQLHLVDRLKDLVVVSGFNVYPSEVEDAIEELADVAAVAVVGADSVQTGQCVVAYIRPVPHADRSRLVESVREHCARRLVHYKRPSLVHLVESLPLTVTGEVQKGRLRAYARQGVEGLLE